jgi:hypothetical protein
MQATTISNDGALDGQARRQHPSAACKASNRSRQAINRRTWAIAGFSAACSLALALAVVGTTSAQAPPAESAQNALAVGRYQISAAGPVVFLVDTTNGELWQTTGRSHWQKAVEALKPKK